MALWPLHASLRDATPSAPNPRAEAHGYPHALAPRGIALASLHDAVLPLKSVKTQSFRASLEQFIKQALGFLFHGQDVGADFVQRAQRLRLVEVAGEADFVTDLGGVFPDPGVGRVGQHFAADEGFDAAGFE